MFSITHKITEPASSDQSMSPSQSVEQQYKRHKFENDEPIVERVKRSKKCRTDNHEKAKLKEEPVMEGADPR